MGDSEEMACSDEDDFCQEALDRFERQRAFQTQLLQQSGGGLNTNAEGAFEFELERFVDRRSDRLGVQERHFNTQLRQRGNLIPGQNITQALQDGLRRAVNQVLTTQPTSTIKIASTSPSPPTDSTIIFRGGDYGRVNGVKTRSVWRSCSTV